MNVELLCIDRDLATVWDIRKMPDGAVFHLYYQVVAFECVNFTALEIDLHGRGAAVVVCFVCTWTERLA